MKTRIRIGTALAIAVQSLASNAAASAPTVNILDDRIGHDSYYIFAFGDPNARDSDVRARARARAVELCDGVFVVIEELLHPKRERGIKDFLIVHCGGTRPVDVRYAPLARYSASYDLANDRYTIIAPADAVTEVGQRGSLQTDGRSIGSGERSANPPITALKSISGCDCKATTPVPCEVRIVTALGRLEITTEPARQCSRVTFSVDGERRTITVPNGSSVLPWIGHDPPGVDVHECQICRGEGR